MADKGTSTDGAPAGPTLEMVTCIQKVMETVRRFVVRPIDGSGEGSSTDGAAGITPASASGKPPQLGWLGEGSNDATF